MFVAVFQMLGLFRLMEVLLNEINYRQGACTLVKYCCLFSCRAPRSGRAGPGRAEEVEAACARQRGARAGGGEGSREGCENMFAENRQLLD